MRQHQQAYQVNLFKKSSQHIQYPNDFHFHYQKSDNECFDQMSPTSTCPSEGRSTFWEYQFDEKRMEMEHHQTNQSTFESGSLSANLLGTCLQKYSLAVSDYIKDCLDYESEKVYEFITVKEFQGLDLQKQEFSNILSKYYLWNKSTSSQKEKFFIQNSTLRTFMQEITYLNHEQINFELIFIISQTYGFKLQGKYQPKDTKEFFDRLAKKENIDHINFKFMGQKVQGKRRQKSFRNFLEKLYEIVCELQMHYKVFEQDEFDQPEIVRNQIKLFSSQRDIWDSDEDEDEEFLRLSCPNKKVKFFTED